MVEINVDIYGEMDVWMGEDDCWILCRRYVRPVGYCSALGNVFAVLVESGTWGSYSLDCACCYVRNEKETKESR